VSTPLTLEFRLEAPDRSIDAKVRLPAEPVRASELLSVILPLAGAVARMSESRAIEQGHTISCREGCGACCRQLVPVSEPEARHLASLVAAMPPDRREQVTERFREARERAAAVLEGIRGLAGEALVEEIGKAAYPYFALGIPCPFLEQESCSIHAQRPAVCREYLVTSQPVHCETMNAEKVQRVAVPVPVSSALLYFSDGRGTAEPRVMPLIDALEFSERAAAESLAPAPEMFRNFIARL
jgi:Fe-S-cluster containining protein